MLRTFGNLTERTSLDVRMAVRGDDFVCLSDGDGLNHVDSLLKSEFYRKNAWRHLDSRIVIRKVFCCCTVCSELEHMKLHNSVTSNLRHTPLIIKESGCNANTKYSQHTTREIARLVCGGRKKESNSQEGRCNTKKICLLETVLFGPRPTRPCGNSKTFGPANERTTGMRLCSTEAWSTISCRETKSCNTIPKTTLTKSQSSWTAIWLAIPSQERARLDWWRRHSEIWIHTSEFDSAERGRVVVLRNGERRSRWTILEIHQHGLGNSNWRGHPK